MSNSENRRLDSIDILRALGIILMVMGHVDFGGKFDRYIHTFHMPVFFLISGFLFTSKKDTNLIKLIGKRAKRLLIPYVVYALINYLFWILLVKNELKDFYTPLIRIFTYNTRGLPICGALWFITALFFAETFYLIIDRIISNNILRSVVVLTVSVGTSFLQNMTEFRLPLTLDIAVVCMGFYEIGRVYKESSHKLENLLHRPISYIFCGGVFAVANLVLAFVNGYVNIKSGWYGIVPLAWINAIIGSMAFYLFALWGDKVTSSKNILRVVLVNIGQNSMVFLGLNQLVILILSLLYGRFNLPENIYISGAIILPISLIILYIIAMLLKRTNKKWIKTVAGL